jgi:hypothetical protein
VAERFSAICKFRGLVGDVGPAEKPPLGDRRVFSIVTDSQRRNIAIIENPASSP